MGRVILVPQPTKKARPQGGPFHFPLFTPLSIEIRSIGVGADSSGVCMACAGIARNLGAWHVKAAARRAALLFEQRAEVTREVALGSWSGLGSLPTPTDQISITPSAVPTSSTSAGRRANSPTVTTPGI